ncbi:hypothetical protein BGZ57DRAFT_974359 [Hyaloscypha finlandica]|nr:hypothetical protein BGZ57DRAFT_974359 [Hyaloscypha finlandica]
MASLEKTKVYRLRNLPDHLDRQSAAELIASCVDDVSPQHIRISSLAFAIDPWTRSPTQTATLTFRGCTLDPLNSSGNGERAFAVPGLAKPLILDHHFRGLTPLNEVSQERHQYDCIVVSGLASHPFGSWQPHGTDKSFMWIRDELPQYLPTIRFIAYGYDTTLKPSNSFQTIPDLANSFIDVLRADGWSSPTAKPLLFLAHSLGGVILKQTLLMLAGSGQKETSIANLIRGVVFFGVPSQGMPMADVITMLGDQPNRDALVREVSVKSEYISQLEKQFAGASFVRTIKLFWAYETKTTRTVTHWGGDKYSRSGPDTILVTRESATSGRCFDNQSLTIQIDENHSDMVKFPSGDYRTRIIASKLADICGIPQMSQASQVPNSVFLSNGDAIKDQVPTDNSSVVQLPSIRSPVTDPLIWDDKRILTSLHAPERDNRMQQIDPQSKHSFDWVYDKASIGFSQWLRNGQGIYWISGKPGSGKSTLMKFIYNDSRTSELLHQWQSRACQITSSFFFHYRGNSVQKSFEGLLRSVISQILEAEPGLLEVIRSTFCDLFHRRVILQDLGSLQADIYRLIGFCKIKGDAKLNDDITAIVQSQNALLSLRRAINASLDNITWHGEISHEAEMELLRRRDELTIHVLNFSMDQIHLFDNTFGEWGLSEFQFKEIIRSWGEKLDLDSHIRRLLRSQGLQVGEKTEQQGRKSHGRQNHDNRENFLENVERGIKGLLKRHSDRNHLRIAIQDEEWSRHKLEEVLRRLCTQSLFDLDLCLLLDALDEYDGRPEFISGFLKDLAQEASFPRTRIRILFSSRPWNVFRKEFRACPGFEIHEHTENDIRNYCIMCIHDNVLLSPKYLLPLVEEIVTRSSGVFLWVKLVLHDLCRIMTLHRHKGDQLKNYLRHTLGSLPDKLDEYYAAIIERVSPGSRWETYVVLESLARSEAVLPIQDLTALIWCSMTKRYLVPKQPQRGEPSLEQAEQLIREVTGCLVDIDRWTKTVQLMHQTVKEFVEAPQFRHMVLGHNRAEMTEENGHSFLAKHLFLINDRRFATHAREAERTTGLSQYEFFTSVPHACFDTPTVYVGDLFNEKAAGHQQISSPLALAVFAGLQLFLEDAYSADKSIVAKSSDPLLCSLVDGKENGLSSEDCIKMAQSLVSKGFVVERDRKGIGEVVIRIWFDAVITWRYQANEDYVNLACLFADHLKNTNYSIDWMERYDAYSADNQISGSILHLSPPSVAERLLDRGADANASDSLGRSPLDYLLVDLSAHNSSAHHLHESSLLLIRHGGKLRKTRRKEWEAFMQFLQLSGFDTEIFRNLGFPAWFRTE